MKWPLCLDGWFVVSFSPVCGLRTIYPALFTLHLQASVKEKHTSWYAKRHISGVSNMYILDPRVLKQPWKCQIYQPMRVQDDKRMNKTFERLLSYGS